jgi:hypothetical protein
MVVSYTLSQYVNDLRAITAKETDPVKITDLVAPLAKKFAQSPELRRPEYRGCDDEQGFCVHLLHEEPNHDRGQPDHCIWSEPLIYLNTYLISPG